LQNALFVVVNYIYLYRKPCCCRENALCSVRF